MPAGVGCPSFWSSSPVGGHPAHGGHDAAEPLAQLQRGVGGQLGRVVEALDLSRAVQQLGEEVSQLLLEVGCRRRKHRGKGMRNWMGLATHKR